MDAMTKQELKATIWKEFPDSRIELFTQPLFPGTRTAQIVLLRADGSDGSCCAARKNTDEEALATVLALAKEPAPGFPGWTEIAPCST